VALGDKRFRLTHRDRVWFPGPGLTKGQVLAYYGAVAPALLAHLRGRPLMLERWPEGIAGGFFYQKNVPDFFPAWLPVHPMEYRGGRRTIRHALVGDAADLLYLVNQGTLTFHAFSSRLPDLERPDLMVIDIDPPSGARPADGSFRRAAEAALLIREQVAPSGVDLFVKTSGKRGLHLAFALHSAMDFNQARDWLAAFLVEVAAQRPDILTAELRKDLRHGRVFLEALRMALGATVVPPYVVRPTPAATVSTPLTWAEMEILETPEAFTVETVPARLEAVGDLWGPLGLPAPDVDWG
jgi:bifunctional non-homologous end joining protein LigD